MAIKRRLSAWNARQYGRMGFVLVFAIIGGAIMGRAAQDLLSWIYRRYSHPPPTPTEYSNFRQFVGAPLSVIPVALIGVLLGALVGNLFLELVEWLVGRWDRKPRGDKVTMVVGTFLGIIASIIPV